MMSMGRIVHELGEQRSLQSSAPVQALPRLGELVDAAVNASGRDNAAPLIKDNCFEIMRHYSPLQIPSERRRNFLILLIANVAGRDLHDLFFVCDSRKQLKLDYLETIRNLPHATAQELKLLMDVGLQALCKDTALGRVFHIKRKGTAPDISKGVLETLALYLNLQASGRPAGDLHPNTQAALQAECRRSKRFAKKLQEYLALYAWAGPALKVVLAEEKNSKKQKSANSDAQNAPLTRIELRRF